MVAAALVTVGWQPAARAGVACVGDCSNSGTVTVSDVMHIINLIVFCNGNVAGCGDVAACANADDNGDGIVNAGELTRAILDVINLPGGCPPAATATPTSPPPPTETPTSSMPPLGSRTFALTSGAGYFSSFLPTSKIGSPAGTLILQASAPDASGHATVTLAQPAIITIPIPAGGLTTCTKVESCTGTLYCNGGGNVDVNVSIDSLAAGLQCVQDGSHSCASSASNHCCSNACEGPGVGSGNQTMTTTGVNATDSGVGAMLLTCMQRGVDVNMGSGVDCSAQDYSSSDPSPQVYSTGTSTAIVLNHCAGGGAPANQVTMFAKTGQNFSCANWTNATGPGTLTFAQPTEEPSSLVTGDGGQAGVFTAH